MLFFNRLFHASKRHNVTGIPVSSTRRARAIEALRYAAPITAPVGVGFLFLGLSYGMLMGAKGFSFVYPMVMSAVIYAGSMEFVTVNLLLSAFNPFAAFTLALMVNARHIFYGLSMLSKFQGTGWKKPFLIYGLCDETFAINSSTRIPEGVDKSWFMLWVTILNQAYWVISSTLGGVLGAHLPFDTRGMEFVLTALFTVIFLDQWSRSVRSGKISAAIGVIVPVIFLIIAGPNWFMLPSLIGILLCCFSLRPWLDDINRDRKVDADSHSVSLDSASKSKQVSV